MKDVMCDLETMGTGPKAAILSIGCVLFDKSGLGSEFYVNVDLTSAVKAGMELDARTIMWWMGQSDAARAALVPDQRSLPTALDMLREWMPPKSRLWGNGATFDNVILRTAYDLAGKQCPWHYRDDRCFRTLKAMWPEVHPQGVSTELVAHNALDDARWQALHAVKILNS